MNTRIKLYAFTFFAFFSMISFAQTISGKVTDKDENPIPYAAIKVGRFVGTTTNEEGEFAIDLKKFQKMKWIEISSLGFKPLKIEKNEFTSKKYVLEDEVNEIGEVSLSSKKLTVLEILEKVQQNAVENYETNLKGNIFARSADQVHVEEFKIDVLKSPMFSKKELKKINKEMNEEFEKDMETAAKSYTEKYFSYCKKDGNVKVNVEKYVSIKDEENERTTEKIVEKVQSRFTAHLDTTSTYKVKTGIFTVDDSLKVGGMISKEPKKKEDNLTTYKTAKLKGSLAKVFAKNTIQEDSKFDFIYETKKYNYELLGVSKYEGENIYIINFNPKRSSAKYIGKMYVSTQDFGVFRIDYKFAEGKKGESLNMKLLLGVAYKENKWDATVIYTRMSSGKFALNFVKEYEGTNIYLNRSLKFIKNRVSKFDKKDKTKLEFKFVLDDLSNTEMVFMNSELLEENDFANMEEREEFKVEHLNKYDASIWEDYNIIKPTKELLEFELN
ncbi:carboxypeptidase-like regulatory domain-containing protein [Aureivirga marina]|uniref:carboxypeptidase-like regulatory domain-containing protein n=1 Tax=Aureivirga marina TaxID=1182451 RepID=UPI0018CA052A|nr:carboxypeptidase-like regulatory domain-containing protein [Aureivirga marina]